MKKRTRNETNNDNENPMENITWSRFINESIGLLDYIAKTELPKFSHHEWQIILNTYSGCLIELIPPFRVASDIMDDLGVVDLEKLDSEISCLIKKIHGLSQSQQYAILDFVRQFWARNWDHVKDFDEIINTINSAK